MKKLNTLSRFPQISNLPPINTAVLPQVQPVSLPGQPKFRRRKESETNNAFFNYNDPDQINSFADVLYKNITDVYSDGEFHIGELLNFVPDLAIDAYNLTDRAVIQPLRDGNYGAATMNSLINVGETLDILANVVKGGLIGGIGQGDDDWFKKATIGRVNYDWDTGNLLTDLGLEILSDPLNWVTFGGKAVATSAVKGAVKETGQEALEHVAKRVTRQLLNEKTIDANSIQKIAESLRGIPVESLHKLKNLTIDKNTISILKATKGAINTTQELERVLLALPTWGAPYIAKGMSKGRVYMMNNLRTRFTNGFVNERDAYQVRNFIKQMPELELYLRDSRAVLDAADTVPEEALYYIGRQVADTELVDLANVFRAFDPKTQNPMVLVMELDAYAVRKMGEGFRFEDYVNMLAQADKSSVFSPLFRELYTRSKYALEKYKGVQKLELAQVQHKHLDDTLKQLEPLMGTDIDGFYFKEGVSELGPHLERVWTMLESNKPIDEYSEEFVDWLHDINNRYDDSHELYREMQSKFEDTSQVLQELREIRKELNEELRRRYVKEVVGTVPTDLPKIVQDYINLGPTNRVMDDIHRMMDDRAYYADLMQRTAFVDYGETVRRMQTVPTQLLKQIQNAPQFKNRIQEAAEAVIDYDKVHTDLITRLSPEIDTIMDEVFDGEHAELFDYFRAEFEHLYRELVESTNSGNIIYVAEDMRNTLSMLQRRVDDYDSLRIHLDIGESVNQKPLYKSVLGNAENTLVHWLDELTEYAQIELKADTSEYALKYTQQATYGLIMESPELLSLLDEVFHYGDAYKYLQQFANEADGRAAQIVLDKLEGMHAGLRIFNDILNNNKMSEEVQLALIDTMHRYGWYDLARVVDSPEYYTKEILKNVEEQIGSSTSNRKFGLEAFRAELSSEELDAIKALHGDDQHNAVFDNELTALLLSKLEPYVSPDGNLTKSFVVDVETTGLHKHQDEVIQLSVRLDDGRHINYLCKSDVDPSYEVKATLFDDKMSHAELDAAYNEIFVDHNLDAIKAKYPNAETILFDDPAKMYAEFFNTVENFTPRNHKAVIHGHNFSRFDMPFIEAQTQRLNIYNRLQQAEIDDTLVRYRKENGVHTLTLDEIDAIDSTIEQYLMSRRIEVEHAPILSRAGMEDLASMKNNKTRVRAHSKFIETLDHHTLSNMADVRAMLKENYTEGVPRELMERFGKVSEAGHKILQNIKDTNRHMSMSLINKDAIPEVYTYLKQDGIFKNIPAEAQNNKNITHLLRLDATMPGNHAQLQHTGAITRVSGSVMNEVLDLSQFSKTVPIHVAEELTRQSKRVFNIAQMIKRMDLLTASADDYYKVQQAILKELEKFQIILTGDKNMFVSQFKRDASVPVLFAQTEFLHRKLVAAYNGAGRTMPSFKAYGSTFEHLGNLDLLSNKLRHTDKSVAFFDVSRKDRSLPAYYEYSQELYDLERRGAEALEQVAILQDAHGIASAKAKVLSSLYHPTYNAFHELKYYMEKQIIRDGERMVPFNGASYKARAEFLSHLREPFDLMNEQLGYSALSRFLGQRGDELLSELYHQRMGFVAFSTRDLANPKYNLLHAYNEMVADLPEGIIVRQHDDMTYFILDNNMDWSHLKYSEMSGDSALSLAIEDPDLNKVMELATEGRARILDLARDANYSTLERVDYKVLEEMYWKIPRDVRDQLPDLGALEARHAFVGNNFNHSILGDIKTRRKYIPHAPYNPLKTQFTAITHIHQKSDAQMHYAQMFFDEGYSLNADLYKSLPDADIAKSIMDSKGGLRLAYLQEHPKKGYVVKSVHVQSAKDLEFARKVNAVPMSLDLFNNTKSILNEEHITNPVIKWLNNNVVYPTKVGYLLTAGFLTRNAFDSTMKNVVSTGETEVLMHTMEVAGIYHKYRSIMRELTADASKPLSEAVEEYFKKGDTLLEKELFETILEVDSSGALSGLTKELQDYYGDSINTLHRRSRFADEISADDIRHHITQPPQVADIDAVKKFGDKPYLVDELDRLRDEFDIYKLAGHMHKHTKNKAVNVTNLVEMIKRPEFIPAEFADEFDRLYRKAKEANFQDTLMQKAMHNPGIAKIFDANSAIEEIARLSLYLYDIRRLDMPKYQAVADVLQTHFDYSHKSLAQQYFEMMFPFSTFATNNFMYWMKQLSGKGINAYKMMNVATPIFNLDEYDEWDINNRRTLQYQILSGNIILNKETGLTMKLNPSVMDAVGIATAPTPGNVLGSRVFGPVRTAVELSKAQPYEWETPEEFEDRKKRMLISTLPVVGPAWLRMQKANDLQEEFSNPVVSMLPSIFNKTSVPNLEQKEALARAQRTYYSGGYRPQGGYSSSRYWRPYVSYPASTAAFNAVRYGGYGGSNPRLSYASRSVMRWKGKSWRLHTKTGRSVLGLMLLPANKYTINMRATLMRRL